MKHKFLEIAGIENEEQFYKKFPTEQSFFDAFRHANFGGEEPLKAMSGIHINPANKGKFNATKQKTGKSTKELTHSKNPITKKRAIFAQNAAKWNKAQGGLNVPKQEDFPDYESFQSAMDAYLYSSGLSNNDQPQQQSRRINFGTIPKQDLPQLENIDQTLSNTSINTNKGPNVPVGEASGLSKAMPYINAGMDVIKGIQQLAAEKKQVKKAKTWAGVTGAQALASQTREQPINRKYVRPEDMIFQPEQLNVPYGAGTNYLAQYGTSIPKAQRGKETPPWDWNEFANQGGTKLASNLGQMIGSGGSNTNAGSSIGNGIGTAAGTAIAGPLGGMVGGFMGGFIGGAVDQNAAKIEAYEEQQTNNLNTVMGQNFAQGIQGQYSAFMERGGNIPSEMESNGELRTYGRGNISPISYNPFLPGGGETIMFEGPPHGKGGMPITYGQNPVEVEGGEPALKLSDGGQMGGDNLVVFGDLTIPKGTLDDVKAKGKFKTYIISLSEKENIYNKLSEKASEGMNGLSVYSPYDKLKENSFKMNWEGANAKLKAIAEKKKDAASLQDAINSTAEKGGLNANSLSRGIIKLDKKAQMPSAQRGKHMYKDQDVEDTYMNIDQPQMSNYQPKDVSDYQAEQDTFFSTAYDEMINSAPPQQQYSGESIVDVLKQQGGNSSYSSRKGLAVSLGIENYKGTAEQNLKMIKLLQKDPSLLLNNTSSAKSSTASSKAPSSVSNIEDIPETAAQSFFTPTSTSPEWMAKQTRISKGSNKATDKKDLKQYDDSYTLNQIANDPHSAANVDSRKRKEFAMTMGEMLLAAITSGASAYSIPKGLGKIAPMVSPKTVELVRNMITKFGPNAGKAIKMGKLTAKELRAKAFENGGELMPIAQKGKKIIKKEEIAEYEKKGYVRVPGTNKWVKKGIGERTHKGKPGTAATTTVGKTPQALHEIPKPVENAWWRSLTPEQKAAHNEKRRAENDKLRELNKIIIEENNKIVNTDTPAVAPTPDIVHAGTPDDEVWTEDEKGTASTNKRSWWMDTFNQVLPYLRPTDTEELDPRQLMGEMFALSNNQLEPVKAQTYQPQLQSPYDISLQEIMNQNQADFNATQRLVGDNPAALAALNAQKYGANEKVLGEQFRVNQANKANIYSDNIKTLNDAQLKNLAIYDDQFVRQEKAKSITKETTQTAFSDISDKYSKNKLRNRELATYQNLYNYRYDPRFTAMNMNPLQQWNTEFGSASSGRGYGELEEGYEDLFNSSGKRVGTRKTSNKDNESGRNGAIVKALKLI